MKAKTAKPSQAERMASLRERVQAWQDKHEPEEIALMVALIQGYSERNAMLIMMQCPTATEVHGFKEWLKLGRCVRRGESGIEIIAPAGREKSAEAGDTAGEAGDTAGEAGEAGEGKPGRQFFRVAYVFDVAQTEPLPAQSAA